MNTVKILAKCLESPPTQEEALFLLQASRNPDYAFKIFEAAAKVRDRESGRVFKLDGEIAPVMPCRITPFCRYCRLCPPPVFS